MDRNPTLPDRKPPLPDISAAILAALAAAGKDLDHLSPDDLAPLDEAHIRGRQATVELADRLDLDGSETILDLGCGLGGAARYLAGSRGCQVTGLDLNGEFIRAAQMLSDRLGLSGQVQFRRGSALEMPFEDGSFDVVWTQHAAMNIADKTRLYAQIARVIKPGGRLAMFDVLAGTGGPAYFPAPWAVRAEDSHLVRPAALIQILEAGGFHGLHWRDTSAEGTAFFQKLLARIRQKGYPPLGPQILFGPRFVDMAENVVRGLEEDRIVVVEAVWKKKS